jgi:hypothetical protein
MDILAKICDIEYKNSKKRKSSDEEDEKRNKKPRYQQIKEDIYSVKYESSKGILLDKLGNSKLEKISSINSTNCSINYEDDNYFIFCDKEDIIKNKNAFRYIRFLKVKVEGESRIYITKDLFGLVKLNANISRDTVKKCDNTTDYDILFLRIPCFNSDTVKGQPQYIFTAESILKILPHFVKYPEFVSWVKEIVLPYFKILEEEEID